ncbi:MAG: hypothetical protein ACE5IW_06650 [bacterium]
MQKIVDGVQPEWPPLGVALTFVVEHDFAGHDVMADGALQAGHVIHTIVIVAFDNGFDIIYPVLLKCRLGCTMFSRNWHPKNCIRLTVGLVGKGPSRIGDEVPGKGKSITSKELYDVIGLRKVYRRIGVWLHPDPAAAKNIHVKVPRTSDFL